MNDVVKKNDEGIKVTVTDKILSWTFLKLIPRSVSPNQVTVFRLFLTPLIIGLLYYGYYFLALVVFIVAAFSDALDGAMARTRNLVTEWGKTLDPLADKLLVGSAMVILAGKYIGIGLVISIIFIELLLIAKVVYIKEFRGQSVQAVWSGKIKMILQSVAVSATLVFAVFGGNTWFAVAQGSFYFAIFFGLISLFVYRSV